MRILRTNEPKLLVWICGLAYATACGSATSGINTTPETRAADSAITAAVAIEATLDPADFPERSVGVLPLRVVSTDSTLAPLGYGLAELLMSDLARSHEVQVVDRLRIQALMREFVIVQAGVGDSSSGPRVGRILGARYLVLGQLVVDQEVRVRVDANLARTEDASVRPVAGGQTSLDQILDAEKALAFQVFDALGVVLTPAERAAVERRPTRNLGALLAYSEGVRAESQLRLDDAWRQYWEALRLDASFIEVQERLSNLEATIPQTNFVGYASVDAINRPHLPLVSDVTDPAFQDRQRAVLILPIIIP